MAHTRLDMEKVTFRITPIPVHPEDTPTRFVEDGWVSLNRLWVCASRVTFTESRGYDSQLSWNGSLFNFPGDVTTTLELQGWDLSDLRDILNLKGREIDLLLYSRDHNSKYTGKFWWTRSELGIMGSRDLSLWEFEGGPVTVTVL